MIKAETKVAGTSKFTANQDYNPIIKDNNNSLYDKLTNAGLVPENKSFADAENINSMCRKSAFNVSGSANGVILTSNSTFSAHTVTENIDKQIIIFKPSADNTGAMTAKVDSAPQVSIVNSTGSALTGGEVKQNIYAYLIYNGSNYELINSQKGLGLLDRSSNIIITRVDNDNLRIPAGSYINAGNRVQKIEFASNYDINIQNTGLAGRATGVTLSADTFYYVWCFTKADGGISAILDQDNIGTLAKAEALSNGFDDETGVLSSVWKTDGSSNLDVNLFNSGVAEYMFLDPNSTNFSITSAPTNYPNLFPSGGVKARFLATINQVNTGGILFAHKGSYQTVYEITGASPLGGQFFDITTFTGDGSLDLYRGSTSGSVTLRGFKLLDV